MSADDDRAAFEAWPLLNWHPDACHRRALDRDPSGGYWNTAVEYAWRAWQAAIAAEREAAAKVCDKAAAESGAHLDALIAAGAPDAMVEKARAVYEAEDCLAAAIRARGAS